MYHQKISLPLHIDKVLQNKGRQLNVKLPQKVSLLEQQI